MGAIFADVLVIENETWITLFTLSGVHSGAADVVAWSPSGNHVATVDKGNDCQALIWDARTKNVVAKHAAKSRILAFAWEASGQVAAFVGFS